MRSFVTHCASGRVEAPVLWKSGQTRIVESREDDEFRFSSMMWADNYWISSNDKDKLTWMVNDIFEEFMELDMEPKRESRGKSWDMPIVGALDLLSYRLRRTGKGIQGTENTRRKGMGSR